MAPAERLFCLGDGWANSTFGLCAQKPDVQVTPAFEFTEPVVADWVDHILEWLGPKAGQVAAGTMQRRHVGCGKANSLAGTAEAAARKAAMGWRGEMMDFVSDVVEDFHAGFRKLGTLLLKACRSAATQAVKAILGVAGYRFSCLCMPASATSGIAQEIYEITVDALRKFCPQSLVEHGVPRSYVSKLTWDFKEDADVGEPKCRRDQYVTHPCEKKWYQ
mmetsp:Transcript_110297/g.312118  ORF Transcript_110297/g.312118 Transcript_110297/m.312118 type:complete len:219 (-) Transcript_110297:28-684(-)